MFMGNDDGDDPTESGSDTAAPNICGQFVQLDRSRENQRKIFKSLESASLAADSVTDTLSDTRLQKGPAYVYDDLTMWITRGH